MGSRFECFALDGVLAMYCLVGGILFVSATLNRGVSAIGK